MYLQLLLSFLILVILPMRRINQHATAVINVIFTCYFSGLIFNNNLKIKLIKFAYLHNYVFQAE